jgi:hypothetical protein
MSKKDYLPAAFKKLLTWLINFITCLGDSAFYSRLGLDPARIETLRIEIQAYRDACTLADNPNAGKADRLDRREKARALDRSVRRYVNTFLRYNENLTDEDRVLLGLTVPDTTSTSEASPSEYPEIQADTSIIRRIRCRFLNREHRFAKPPHVHGTELRSGFIPEGETPSLVHLTNSSFSTRSSITLDFPDENRAKRLGLCARYENNTGGKGPFGPIVVVIIP